MKNLLTTLALCAFMSPAFAAADDRVTCTTIGDIAQVIMEARQAGVAPSAIMEAMEGVPIAPFMIAAAFEVDRWHSEQFQIHEVQDFRADWETKCYTQLSEAA